jgi:hypothetical protein
MVSDEETLAVFRKYPMRNINWLNLSCSDEARLRLLKEHPHHINWNLLTMNKSTFAVSILRENQDKIRWHYLSSNPNRAVELLRKNPDKINWDRLSSNPCGDAVKLLRENPEKNQLGRARETPLKSDRSAAKTPEKSTGTPCRTTPTNRLDAAEYPDKINWNILSFNPQTG